VSDQFLAEIRIFPFNFAPTGWALCNGQLLPISQNTAVFSLLGVNYGGNGTSNFSLPNLQGSAPMHWGQGPSLADHYIGESSGAESVTLISSEMPAHVHTLYAVEANGSTSTAAGNALAKPGKKVGPVTKPINQYTPYTAQAAVSMAPLALYPAGGSLPHNNLQPYLTLNFCIALTGIFPARS